MTPAQKRGEVDDRSWEVRHREIVEEVDVIGAEIMRPMNDNVGEGVGRLGMDGDDSHPASNVGDGVDLGSRFVRGNRARQAGDRGSSTAQPI